MKRFFSLGFLCLLFATALPAYADIAKPNPSPRPSPSPQQPRVVLHTSFSIVPDNKAYEARLQISESQLTELRAALANIPANDSVATRITRGSTRTMLAGVFMFLSLSFAGVWLARSVQTRGRKLTAALLVVTALSGAAAIIVNANAGPPGSYYWRKLPQNLTAGKPTNGGIDIEIVPDSSEGAEMKLIIPQRPN
jgi:hypothetical protein